MDINGTLTELEENQLLVCPPNTSFTNFMLSPEFEFKAIFVTNRMLQTFLREKMTIWTDMFYVQRIHVITIDEEDIVLLNHFYDMLQIIIYSKKTYTFHNEVSKDKSGKAANEWIREHVLEDIRYNLKHTDLSIKQICNKLGFPNPSFFGKYVKEHFGMPPAQFRYG